MLFEKIQLERDEKIIKIAHKHWFVFVSQALSIATVAVAPLLGWLAVGFLTQQQSSSIDINLVKYTPYFVYFYSFWLLINWMTLAHIWVTHHLDIWVITNRRIVVIDQVSLFRRKIGSFRLEKLQDVNIEINGMLATFLHYGIIEAETASNNSDAEFRSTHMPNPRGLKATILKVADDLMEEHSAVQSQRKGLQ